MWTKGGPNTDQTGISGCIDKSGTGIFIDLTGLKQRKKRLAKISIKYAILIIDI